MKQEDKKLLLKDLCARLPYGIKVNAPFTTNKQEKAKGYKINSINFGVVEWTPILFGEKKRRNSIIIEAFSEKYNQYCSIDIELNNTIEEVKPYLFPISSMNEEQKQYLKNRFCYDWDGGPYDLWKYQIEIGDADELVDWFHKNHFDYRVLINKDLALDATGLNIY